MARYELDYTVKIEDSDGDVSRTVVERGTLAFDKVQDAQEFCSSPAAMLEHFGAFAGLFELWGIEEGEDGENLTLWWTLRYDTRAAVNRVRGDYRMFTEAIFEMVA